MDIFLDILLKPPQPLMGLFLSKASDTDSAAVKQGLMKKTFRLGNRIGAEPLIRPRK